MSKPDALEMANLIDGAPFAVNGVTFSQAAAELRRLHAENEALRKDAERYRFLRDVPFTEEIQRMVSLQKNALWDATIDAAKKGHA